MLARICRSAFRSGRARRHLEPVSLSSNCRSCGPRAAGHRVARQTAQRIWAGHHGNARFDRTVERQIPAERSGCLLFWIGSVWNCFRLERPAPARDPIDRHAIARECVGWQVANPFKPRVLTGPRSQWPLLLKALLEALPRCAGDFASGFLHSDDKSRQAHHSSLFCLSGIRSGELTYEDHRCRYLLDS